MDQVASVLFVLSAPDLAASMVGGRWDLTSAGSFIAVILIVGFAAVAAAWTIRRDV